MAALEWILGFALIALAVFLTIAVLSQSGKDKRLSGTIAGGSDTYYGQNKGKSRDKIIGRLTMIAAIVFGVVVIATYIVIARFGTKWEPKEDDEADTAAAVYEMSETVL